MAVVHEDDESTATSPRRGRPPDLAKRKAILDATLEVLAEVGYTALTIDAVAQRAHSNRVLVYRVWDSKVALVCDAIFGSADRLVVPDTGSTTKDLRQFIRQLVAHMSLPAYVKGAPGVTVEMLTDPTLFRDTYRRYVKPTEDGFAAIIGRGRTRGEINGKLDPWLLTRVVSGITTNLAQTERLSADRITDVILATFINGLVPYAEPADERA